MEDIIFLQGSRYKVHNTLDENDTKNYRAEVAEIWEAGETFDPKTERLFRYLQVKTTMPYLWLYNLREAIHVGLCVRACCLKATDVNAYVADRHSQFSLLMKYEVGVPSFL